MRLICLWVYLIDFRSLESFPEQSGIIQIVIDTYRNNIVPDSVTKIAIGRPITAVLIGKFVITTVPRQYQITARCKPPVSPGLKIGKLDKLKQWIIASCNLVFRKVTICLKQVQRFDTHLWPIIPHAKAEIEVWIDKQDGIETQNNSLDIPAWKDNVIDLPWLIFMSDGIGIPDIVVSPFETDGSKDWKMVIETHPGISVNLVIISARLIHMTMAEIHVQSQGTPVIRRYKAPDFITDWKGIESTEIAAARFIKIIGDYRIDA